MDIKASDVMKLRAETGSGMMEAKSALAEANGDFAKAVDILRKKSGAKAAKKADRLTAEGRAHCYTHANGKIGVVVEVLCETDFVARNESFIAFCNDLALHIAAIDPTDNAVLLEQPFVKDESITIKQLVESKIQALGENIQIGRFKRIGIGE